MSTDRVAASQRASGALGSARRGVRGAVRNLRRRIPVAVDGVSTACNAPFASLYLDKMGNVRACCQNSDHSLGNITRESLRTIWDGHRTAQLREAVAAGDFTLGCQFCRWQAEDGNDALVFARTFDHLAVESATPRWPTQMEMSLSNACNLQCVMCNGDWSSSIRTHREGRPPLPEVYGDEFFSDLRAFLPHLRVIKILGGEPFLSKESLRVMETLVEMSLTPEIHVTTNGTQWSPRVERILDSLPLTIVLSLDGCDAETYESIRIGSNFDTVMTNLESFQAYAKRHNSRVNLAHCLMASNWHRFPDFLRFAEERSLTVYVNTVTFPVSMSLFHLSPSKLRRIIDDFESVDATLRNELTLNRAIWIDQLDRLRHRADQMERGANADYYLGVQGFTWRRDRSADLVPAAQSDEEAAVRLLRSHLGDEVEFVTIHASVDAVAQSADPPEGELLGVPVSDLIGKPLDHLPGIVGHGQDGGQPHNTVTTDQAGEVQVARTEFRDGASLLGVRVAARDEEGVIAGIDVYMTGVPVRSDVELNGRVAESAATEGAAEFRATIPDDLFVEVVIDDKGRVRAVSRSAVLDKVALDHLVGEDIEGLMARFVDVFGPLTAQELVAVGGVAGPSITAHQADFGPLDQPSLRITAVACPLPDDSSYGSGSRILMSLQPADQL